MQQLPGAGDADVGEAPFLLQLIMRLHGPQVREDSLLHACQEYRVEFQALRGVQGHQGHHCMFFLPAGELVGVSHQGDPLQERGQRRIGLGHSRRQCGVVLRCLLCEIDGTRRCGELCRHVHQLLQVLQARLVLGICGVLQLREVPGAGEHRGEDRIRGFSLGHHHAVPLDQVDESADLFRRAGGQPGCLVAA